MTPSDETEKPAENSSKSIDEIEADLKQSREQLAETVDALTAKLDVKARAGEQLADTKERATHALHESADAAKRTLAQGKAAATDARGRPTPEVTVGSVVVVVAMLVVAVVVWRRRR